MTSLDDHLYHDSNEIPIRCILAMIALHYGLCNGKNHGGQQLRKLTVEKLAFLIPGMKGKKRGEKS